MSTQIMLRDFENLYNDTYENVLKYVVCNSLNIDEINDIVQNTYVELYTILKRKKTIKVENVTSYIVGIAKNKIYRHFGSLKRQHEERLIKNIDYDSIDIEIPDTLDIENDVILKEDTKEILNYIKRKDILTARIFYLYYGLDLKISEIATELNITESNIKNRLYRTLKELRKEMEGRSD